MCEIYKNLSLEDMEGEIWKDIEDYEGLYQISNMGRIKRLSRKSTDKNGNTSILKEKMLKQHLTKIGYLDISLTKNKKQKHYYVHRLVGFAFIPNPKNKKTINHKNEIKTDNRVENLEWMTQAENNVYGTKIEKAVKKREEYKNNIGQGNFKDVLLEQFPSFNLIDDDILAFLSDFNNPWVVNTYVGLLNIKGLETNKKELEQYYSGNPIITCPGNILAYGLKIKEVRQKEIECVKEALITLHEAGIIYLEELSTENNTKYIVSKIKRTTNKVQKQKIQNDQIYRLRPNI